MSQLVFDEEAARRIEAVYRIADAARRRAIVREALGARPGERVLDVGCGPGFYCAELLGEVGPSGWVVGVDGSAPMLRLAARRCAAHDNVELRAGDARSLPVDDASFDAALCVQVLEYVGDVAAALGELHRALRPGGRVLVWDIDWATLSVHAPDAGRCARVLDAWDEHLTHRSLPRTLAARMRAAGFADVRAQAHPLLTLDLDPDSFGGALAPFIAGFAPGRQAVTEEEAQAWLAEQRDLGRRGEAYFAVTQICFTAHRPA